MCKDSETVAYSIDLNLWRGELGLELTKTRHCAGLPQGITIPTIGNPPLRKQASGLKCGLVWADSTLVTFNEDVR